jgi:hypothetical protein
MKKYLLALTSMFTVAYICVPMAQAGDLTEWLAMKGDLRNRFEYIDKDGSPSRERFRIRARLALDAVVNENADVHARLVTGGSDPVSANQTLSGGFSTKDFGLDHFYLDLHPQQVEGLNIYAGKMKQPWYTVKDLIWDGDLSPEGFAVNYGAGDTVEISLHGGAFVVEERKAESDSYLFSAQASARIKPTEGSYLVGGAGYFAFTEMEGNALLVDDEDAFGNSTVEIGAGDDVREVYANEYNEIEGFLVGGLDLAVPVKVYVDYVVNTEASSDDTGFMAGATLGKAKDVGSWEFDYNYRDLERDAVVGAFTDSDPGGGGTDVSGHRCQAKYQLARNLQLAATWFLGQVDDGDTDYNRGQLDLVAKF